MGKNVVEWNESETTRLGTELEVVADFDLTPLVASWADQTSEVRNPVDAGRHTLWLQLNPAEETLTVYAASDRAARKARR